MSTPISASAYDPSNAAPPAKTSAPSSTMDKNGFLRLLTAQMSNQDPTSNQDPAQYFQTISSMTMVEQLTNLASNSDASIAAQRNAAATALIGKTVSYVGSDGLPVSGLVESVQITSAGSTLTVAGRAGIGPATVTEVR